MSSLQYFAYEGFGDRVVKDTHYHQAVRVGDIVKCSGQGGWDRKTEVIPSDLEQEMANTFDNVEHTLQQAGSKGWEDVYSVRVFFAPEYDQASGLLVANLRKYCPNHQPLLTAVMVSKLYGKMRVEIEVEAYVGQK